MLRPPAQSFSPTASAEPVSAAADSLHSTVGQWIEKGQSFEANGRWAEALSHYEEALREHPEEPVLTGHFDTARLHYSLEQRYDDRSFQDSVRTLNSRDSLDLYGDLLAKIGTHYYTAPPWQDLFRRGAQSLDIALTDQKFLATNGVRANASQIEQLRTSLRQLSARYKIASRSDAMNVVTQAAQLGRRQVGLPESATILEFTAAAASALDHYSAFLTADQLRDIYSQIEGNFVGLGVELKADNGALLIVHVIPNSPAQGAGILDGDRIVAVAGQSTSKMSTDEAATLLTGPEGSVCRVSVVTAGQQPRELNVRRAHVEVPSLEDVKILDPAHGVAYVRIPAFQKTTARDLETALWDLHAKGMRSLVLDLRGNPGGLLTASVEVADKFIADGAIVSTRGRSEQENFNYRAHRPGTWRVPLVVLIDGDSASASEIFAAAIKDSQPRQSDRHAFLRQRFRARHLPARLRRRRRSHHHRQVLLAHGQPNRQRRSNPRYRHASWQAGCSVAASSRPPVPISTQPATCTRSASAASATLPRRRACIRRCDARPGRRSCPEAARRPALSRSRSVRLHRIHLHARRVVVDVVAPQQLRQFAVQIRRGAAVGDDRQAVRRSWPASSSRLGSRPSRRR